jgi:hypothetical protein
MSPVRLDTVSSEHGSGAPSFGDLFEEPETPLRPPAPPAETATPEQPPVPAAPAPPSPPQPSPPQPASPQPASPQPEDAAPAQPGMPAPFAAEPVLAPEPSAVEVEPVLTPAPPLVVEPAAEAPAAPGPAAEPEQVAGWDHAAPVAPGPVNTGRLYRSTGAEGPQTLEAIPALDPEWLASREQPPLDPAPGAPGAAAAAAAAATASASATVTPEPRVQGGAGLTWTGVFVVTTAATVLIGVADALITGRLGWLTGLALAVSSIYSAFVVRRVDIWAAVIAPPLAFLVAVLTAGQLTLDSAGSLLLREGYMVFRSLATNAPWILGTTLACLVIVLLRRRRA